MGFWSYIVIMVLGIVIIQAVKDVANRQSIRKKELKKLNQDINEIKSELKEIKEYIADLVIKSDQI